MTTRLMAAEAAALYEVLLERQPGFRTLRSLGIWSGGGTPSKGNAAFWTDGTIPWVSPKDMKVERIRTAEDHITSNAIASSATNLVKSGAVVMVVRSGILRHSLPVAVTEVDVALNQDMKALQPADGVDASYVAWALRANTSRILHECAKEGTTVQSIEFPTFLDFEIPLPSPEAQRQVVDYVEEQLSRLDASVAALLRAQANLKRYRASVLKAACEGRLVPTEAELARAGGRSFETGAQLLQRVLSERRSGWMGKGKFKEPGSPNANILLDVPEGWATASIDQIGEVITGFTPPTSDSGNFGGSIPFFKPTDLDAGYNTREAREWLTDKGASAGRLLRVGSVLVTCIGATIGKTGLARVDCTTNQQINAVTAHESGVLAEYVFCAVCSPSGQEAIRSNASSTTLPILNKSKFAGLTIPLPPLAEQHRIVAEADRRLSLIRGAEAQVNANLARAKRLRQSILQAAFAAPGPV